MKVQNNLKMLNKKPSRPTQKYYGWLWIGLLSVWLSACGFQLRGSSHALSFQGFQITGVESAGSLVSDLTTLLQQKGIQSTQNPEATKRSLFILEFDIAREIFSLTANARVAEYKVLASAKFELRSTEGEILHEGSVEASSVYTRLPATPLANSHAEAAIRTRLLRSLARQILASVNARAAGALEP